jgi:glutamate--cysteine ligase catalytic subunit
MRFKPPPRNSNIGWRVEFRSMDILLTDHENAAFSIFVVLLTRTILHFNLNFYQPLSQVDENMQTAQKKDAVNLEKFWFRTGHMPSVDHFELQSIDKIMNGTKKTPGLISLVDAYLDSEEMDNITRLKLKRYTNLIRMKASGAVPTCAKWMRDYVTSHPDYKHDSVVSQKVSHDLLKKIIELDCQLKSPLNSLLPE